MKLTIHRGTHEIGGSCVELCSNSGKTSIVIDVGMPLVTPEMLPFEWRHYKDLSQEQLLEQRILPAVEGLYNHQKPSISAVMLSHAHQDHYGFIRFLHPDIPLYMSIGTESLVEVSNLFLDTGVNLDQVQTFTMWQSFRVRELTITPYLMDHSAPDAAAFLIEADGQRLFYTGDFRGHGRKQVLLERLLANPIFKVDCLVMEGSMIGREEGQYQDEDSVEQAIYDVIANQKSYTFIFCSSQNLDRLVSVFRAVKRAHKTFVIDLYTAFVLDKLRSIPSNSIPQFNWKEIRVLYAYSHAKNLAEYNKALLYKYKEAKIEWEEIKATPQDMVILGKDNFYFRRIILPQLEASSGTKAVYSLWHGYLKRTDLVQFLDSHNIELLEIHTSGHAYVEDLKKLAHVLDPRFVVPIHTFHPEQYSRIYENIVQLDDGETYYL
jgi:ribonuclease J